MTRVTRRTFVKTGAAAAGLAASGAAFAAPYGLGALEALGDTAEPLREVLTFCDNPCSHQCGELVRCAGERPLEAVPLMTDRFSNGRLCGKAHASLGDGSSPYRVLHPMKRVGDDWIRTDWDTALDDIAAQLRELRLPWMERGGISAQTRDEKELVAFYTTPRVRGEGLALLYRFKRAYSARPHFGGCQACGGNFLRAAKSLFANMSRTNTDTDLANNSKAVVMWGSNWAVTMPVAYQHVMKAQARGARVTVIDTRMTPTAAKADRFVALRPGTDGALALGIINQLFALGLEYARLDEYVVAGDVDKLRAAAAPYTPEYVESLTWVPAATVTELAQEIGAAGRQTAQVIGSALSAAMNGYQTMRSVMCISVVLGALGVLGGGLHAKPGMVGVMQLPTCGSVQEWWRFGTGVVNDLYNPGDQAPHETYEGMVEGRVKVLFSTGSLVASRPNASALVEGLERMKDDGLIVHMGMYEDECAEYAHYFLPLASELEEAGSNLFSGASNALRWKERVVAPIGESRSYGWIWNELGKRVFGDELCTETTFSGEMTGRDNPEYQQPIWPYETFAGGAGQTGFAAEATFTYFRDISWRMMQMNLMMQGLTEAQATQRNPYGRLTLANVKAKSAIGGITFPAPLMGPENGMPLLYSNSADPGLPLFNTPDKKVHIDIGVNWHNGGVPEFVDSQEGPIDRTETIDWSEEYPLYMVTAKPHAAVILWASRWDGVSSDSVDKICIEINPLTAAHLGLSDGDLARVISPRGSIEMAVRCTARVHPKVINVPAGAGSASVIPGFRAESVNVLTTDAVDPHTDIPGYKSARCSVVPV